MAFGDLKVQDLIYEDGSNNEITVVLANLVVRDGSGDLVQADNKKFIAGTGSDLQIYHDGSNSWIKDTGTGMLRLSTNGSSIELTGQSGSEYLANFIQDGAVNLYYDGSKKFETSANGVVIQGLDTVTSVGSPAALQLEGGDAVGEYVNLRLTTAAGGTLGNISAKAVTTGNYPNSVGELIFSIQNANATYEALKITSNRDINIPTDGKKLQLGASQDLQIYHDGSDNFLTTSNGYLKIKVDGSNLYLDSNETRIRSADGGETQAKFIDNGAVELYYDHSKKIETTSVGVKFWGTTANLSWIQNTNDDKLNFNDGVKATFGNANDLQIYHAAGSDSYIKNITAGSNLQITSASEVQIKVNSTENAVECNANGSVDLYYDNSKKFETTSGGVNVVGALTINGSPLAGGVSSDAQGNTVGGTGPGDAFTSTAYSNTLFGKYAGQYITTGDANTIIGYQGTGGISTGSKNTLIGSGVGASGSNTARVYEGNTFIGHNMAQECTSGSYNIAIGKSAANDLTTGSTNIYIGQSSGYSAGAAQNQIGIGQDSMKNCTSTVQNIGIGLNAGEDCTGSNNTLIGLNAAYNLTSGSRNVALGSNSFGSSTVTGGDNIAIGAYSMDGFSSGNYNIAIGYGAGASNAPSGTIGTGSYNICLGDNNIQNLYCADTSISSSDSRDKVDVVNFTHGLSWINKLNPITYRWDKRTWYNEYNEDGSFKAAGTPDGSKKRARQHIGFLAQDVLAIEQADGYASKKDDMLVVNLNEDDTAYGLKYERLVPVLVNAIKELSTEVNTLKTKVAALEA